MNVSKPVVYAAGVTILALVAAVFFLLGRESTHRRATANAAAADALAGPHTIPAPTLPPMPDNARGEAPLPDPPEPPSLPHPAPLDLPHPVAPAAAPAAPVGGDDAAAVRSYFTQIAAIQEVAPSADTGEFANKVLTGMMQGDTSAFDGLITLAEDGAKRAAAITPPPACATYHQHLLALLADSTALMRQLKPAIASSDVGTLTSLAGNGNVLKAKTDALDAEARAIKQRYGIAN